MYMIASETFTAMDSAASSMLNGPSNFSETRYKASGRKKSKTKGKTQKMPVNEVHYDFHSKLPMGIDKQRRKEAFVKQSTAVPFTA